MGRSAKGYKKPTLKEKQQTRKAKSSLSADVSGSGRSSGSGSGSGSGGGLLKADWSQPSATIRMAAAAMRQPRATQSAGPSSFSSTSKTRAAASIVDEDDDDDDNEEDGGLGMQEDDEDEEEGEDADGEGRIGQSKGASADRGKKKRGNLRARSKKLTPSSTSKPQSGTSSGEEARTPRDQGIDYVNLWAGRKKEITSARIKQGRAVK